MAATEDITIVATVRITVVRPFILFVGWWGEGSTRPGRMAGVPELYPAEEELWKKFLGDLRLLRFALMGDGLLGSSDSVLVAEVVALVRFKVIVKFVNQRDARWDVA